MRWKTARLRERRNRQKRRGHTLIVFNRGIWLRLPPEDAAMGAQCTIDGREQPRAYVKYK